MLNIRKAINDRKEINSLICKLEDLKEEVYLLESETKRIKDEMKILNKHDFHERLFECKNDADCMSVVYLEMQTLVKKNAEDILCTSNDINCYCIELEFKAGVDFELYKKEIESGTAELPLFNYDLIVKYMNEQKELIHSQLVHCYGNGDGCVYSPIASKNRETRLESSVYIANAIASVLKREKGKDFAFINKESLCIAKEQIKYKK